MLLPFFLNPSEKNTYKIFLNSMRIFTYCIPLLYILLLVKCSVSLEYSKMPELSFIYITVVYQKESKKTVSVNIYNKVYLA